MSNKKLHRINHRVKVRVEQHRVIAEAPPATNPCRVREERTSIQHAYITYYKGRHNVELQSNEEMGRMC